MPSGSPNALLRLCKHADYQRVYKASRKQFSRQMTFFFALRAATGADGTPQRVETAGPRVGLTVGKVIGKAVERNRIKRRLRELVRRYAAQLTFPVDVILHPRRTVLELESPLLDREVAHIFRTIQATLEKAQRVASSSSRAAGVQPASRGAAR
jgi:ribonuclease P protein component